ncbi:ATP-dependent (S)-NAD(P)H-hydrate dehydratase-like [Trifolium pratense]|uniref:ATP-dependent (S)-NAD(P)H-hydrate dehydratase-like n=1 Tax=Trifolium pratense TaxID=57577 RepID=UPI001E694D6D|nr:ATP-dependent (S)-NAD(P)H-hydrate dehydratase-like [Trifolium pratense]
MPAKVRHIRTGFWLFGFDLRDRTCPYTTLPNKLNPNYILLLCVDLPTVGVSELGIFFLIHYIWQLKPYQGCGKIAVIGGCREYTGAPYFAAISALKIGADLSHVFCTKDAAPVIKSYSPELIVQVLEESYSVREEDKKIIASKVLAEVDKWLERFDCLVIGPGLGRDPFLLDCVTEIIRHARKSNIPIVIDGDGIFLVTNHLELVSGYALAVLTPNINEYKRLVQKVPSSEVNNDDATRQVLSLAKHQISKCLWFS